MEEHKKLISKLKEQKFSHLVFSLRHPYGVEFSKKLNMAEEHLAITELLDLLEAEPSSGPVGVVPDLRATSRSGQRSLITTKYIDFAERTAEPEAEEIPEQYTTTTEQVYNNF